MLANTVASIDAASEAGDLDLDQQDDESLLLCRTPSKARCTAR